MYYMTTVTNTSILILIPLNLIIGLVNINMSNSYLKGISLVLCYYIAFILKIFYHVLYLPFQVFHAEIVFHAEDQLNLSLNIYNLIVGYIIIAYITEYGIDYRIMFKDQLNRRDEGYFQLIVMIETILIIIHGSNPVVSLNLMLHACFNFVKLFYVIESLPFFNQHVQRIYFCSAFSHLFSAIIFLLIYNT